MIPYLCQVQRSFPSVVAPVACSALVCKLVVPVYSSNWTVPVLSGSCQYVGAQFDHVRVRMQTDVDEVKGNIETRFDGDFNRYLVHLHKIYFSRCFDFYEVNLQPYYCNPILVSLILEFHFCSATLMITELRSRLRLMMTKRPPVVRHRSLWARCCSPLRR